MNYVSGFCQHLLPQTSGFTSVAHDKATASAVLERIRSPGRARAVEELHAVANEYGLLVSYEGLHTVRRAVAFLGSLPAGVHQPDICVDPDGDISLEWINESAALSVSIGPSGRLVYATNVEGFSSSGESFFGGAIPNDVLGPLLHFR